MEAEPLNERPRRDFNEHAPQVNEGTKKTQMDRWLEVPNPVQRSLSLLGLWGRRWMRLFMRPLLRSLVATAWAYSFSCKPAFGYGTVILSTATTQETERDFIAATTNHYLVGYTVNPLASNTWTMKLFGVNPNFNPPPTYKQLFDAAVTVSSWSYPAGFGNGEDYAHGVDNGIVENYTVNCSTPLSGVAQWDPATCEAVTIAIDQEIFRLKNSTPTLVPGGF